MTAIHRADRRARRLLTLAFLAAALALWCPWRGNGIDDVFYYSYLTSLFFDGDVDVRNDYYLSHNSFDMFLQTMQFPFVDVTDRGLIRNVFAMGAPLIALPFWGVAGAADTLAGGGAGAADVWPPRRFGYSYLVAVSLARLFYGYLALMLIYRLARYWARPRAAAWAALGVFGASPLLYYVYSANFMAHTASAFTVALMLAAALRWRRWDDARGAALLGLAAGLAALARWQNVIFALIPAVLWLRAMLAARRENGDGREYAAGRIAPWRAGLIAAAAGLILLSMQFFYWHAQGRHFIGIPQGPKFLKFTAPKIFEVLFSGMHGLFYWHPLLLAGAAGLAVALRRRAGRSVMAAGLAALALMIYVNATAGDWYGGGAFGARRFSGSVPLLGVGLAAALALMSQRKESWAVARALTALAVLFNVFLFQAYQHGVLDYSFWRELWLLRGEWGALAAWLPRGAALNSGVWLAANGADHGVAGAALLAALIGAMVAAGWQLLRRGVAQALYRRAAWIAGGAAALALTHNFLMMTVIPADDPAGLALRSFLWRSPAAHREVVRELIDREVPYEPAILFAHESLRLDDFPTTRALAQMERANPWVWAKWMEHLGEGGPATPAQRTRAAAIVRPLPLAFMDEWNREYRAALAAGDRAGADRALARMLGANPLHPLYLEWHAENCGALGRADDARRLRERRCRALLARVENYVRLAEAHPDLAGFILGGDTWARARTLRQMNFEEDLPERAAIDAMLTRAAALMGDERLMPKPRR